MVFDFCSWFFGDDYRRAIRNPQVYVKEEECEE